MVIPITSDFDAKPDFVECFLFLVIFLALYYGSMRSLPNPYNKNSTDVGLCVHFLQDLFEKSLMHHFKVKLTLLAKKMSDSE